MHVIPVSQILKLPRCDVAGIDAGGTKAHMRYVDPSSGAVSDLQVRTADYDSLENLFHTCFLLANCLPRIMVAGVAGRLTRDGDVRITNHPQWPVFRRGAFAAELSMTLTTINDMVATVAGVGELPESEYELLTSGISAPQTLAKLAVSVGTGVGSACMDASGNLHSAESGHVYWQPVTAPEEAYLASLQKLYPGVPVSVEQSIGGLRGFDYMYEFMRGRKKPGPYIQQHVDRYRREHRGIAPVISAAAVEGDGCCREIIRLFGAILGQYIRSLALTYLSEGGSMWFTSGVLQAPSVAEILMNDTPLQERFISAGAEHYDLMQRIPLYLVNDREVAVRGAFSVAQKALGHDRAPLSPL